MKSKDCQYTKKRRGLSSIVGALLFVVLMVATFSVLAIALNSQTDIVETSRDVTALGLKQQQEEFIIFNIVQPVADDLEVEILNKGQNPTEIFTLIITEVDDPAGVFPTTTYDIPSSTGYLVPGDDDATDILSNTPIFLDLADPLGVPPTTTIEYEIKVISSLGTIKALTVICNQFTCNPGGGEPGLDAQLFMDGPNGVNSKTSTIIMFVTNNGEVPLTGVGPLLGLNAGECDNMWQNNVPIPSPPNPPEITDVDPCDLDSPTPVNLVPGQSAFFKWDGAIFGDVDDEAIFCNQARGFDPIASPVDSGIVCDDLTVINPNTCGGAICEGGGSGTTIILIDDLLIRPSLFMVVPSPFGDTDGSQNYKDAVWGVNVANPTKSDMQLTKLTIVSYPPGANNNDIVFNDNTCLITGINPTTDWSCPRLNTMLWQNFAAPITIPSYSVVPFLAQLEPGSIAGNADVDALIVQANAFTTTGSFGKSSYQSTMFDTPESLVNVFLTNTPESRIDILSNRTGILELTPETFQVTLADMDNDPATYIKSGAKLIVNVPREWTDVCIQGDQSAWVANGTPDPDCTIDDRITLHGDLSHQIIVKSLEDIGGGAGTGDARTIEFTATTSENDPDGLGGVPKRLYIMYALADGLTGGDNKIGPLNEIVLQVVQP